MRAQVGEVADAPAAPAAGGVQLHRPAPGPPALGQPAAAGGDDQPADGGRRGCGASGSRAGSRRAARRRRAGPAPSSQTTSASSTSRASPGRATIGARVLQVGRRLADRPRGAGRSSPGSTCAPVQGVEPGGVDAPAVGGVRVGPSSPAASSGCVTPPWTHPRVRGGRAITTDGRAEPGQAGCDAERRRQVTVILRGAAAVRGRSLPSRMTWPRASKSARKSRGPGDVGRGRADRPR